MFCTLQWKQTSILRVCSQGSPALRQLICLCRAKQSTAYQGLIKGLVGFGVGLLQHQLAQVLYRSQQSAFGGLTLWVSSTQLALAHLRVEIDNGQPPASEAIKTARSTQGTLGNIMMKICQITADFLNPHRCGRHYHGARFGPGG
jgi:hypothetical protein